LSAVRHGFFLTGFMLCDRCVRNGYCDRFRAGGTCAIEEEAFDRLVEALVKGYALDGVTDTLMAERAAMTLIRLARVEAHEAAVGVSDETAILGRYIERLDRMLLRILEALAVTRGRRKGLERGEALDVSVTDLLRSVRRRTGEEEGARRCRGLGRVRRAPGGLARGAGGAEGEGGRAAADLRIPRGAVRPLLELSLLLGRMNGREAEDEFRGLLRVMNKYRGHLASHPWPEGWSYGYAVGLDEEDRSFIARGRKTGKTKTTTVKALHFGFVNEGTTVLVVSPGLRQSTYPLEMASGLLQSSPVAMSGVESLTETRIELKNGSRILALSCSENLIRGYTADLIVCDEAAFMPEEVILRVLFPMLATTDGALILLSTPWGRDHLFYRAYQNPEYAVFHVSAADSPLVSKELLEEQRGELSEEAFRMEYLAEFAEPATCFFPQDLIRGCVDPDLQLMPRLEVEVPEGLYYGGSDLGKLAYYSVLAVLRKAGERLDLVYLRELPLGMPYTEVIGLLARAERAFRFQRLYVDQTGVGEPVLDELKGRGAPHAKGVTLTVGVKEEVMTSLKLAMEQRQLRMPYLRRLFAQINEQRYAYALSGRLSFSHPPRGHDDQLWGLPLAVYASTKERRPHPPRAVSIR